MDIFTTQLRRVVQTPIKPSNSKVKGPAKEPSTTQLTEDFDHLEHHEKYTERESKNEHADQDEKAEQKKNKDDKNESEKVKSENNDESPHLDIYV